jgi:hypothetical protein
MSDRTRSRRAGLPKPGRGGSPGGYSIGSPCVARRRGKPGTSLGTKAHTPRARHSASASSPRSRRRRLRHRAHDDCGSLLPAPGSCPREWWRGVSRYRSAAAVYTVSLSAETESLAAARAEVPISRSALECWLEVRLELLLDKERPTAAQLARKLAAFWLPDEVMAARARRCARASASTSGPRSARAARTLAATS